MNKNKIITLAREAGFKTESWTNSLHISVYANGVEIGVGDKLERFAALVAAHEREACAKVCEEEANRAKWNWDNDISGNQPFWNGGEQLASNCAAAIRARGEK